MKKGFCVLTAICCVMNLLFAVSCGNKYPTYDELVTAEKKEIKRIIAEKNISVLTEYPANGVFGVNEFVELSSGIYLNVVDSGNGNRAKVSATTVLIRAELEYYSGDSVVKASFFSNTSAPFEFKYGYAYNTVQAHAANAGYGDPYALFFSLGLESVLSYVGEGAEVKLIVPAYSEISNQSGGSTFQTSSRQRYVPIYYGRVKYTFY
jgi:hypothetical protein